MMKLWLVVAVGLALVVFSQSVHAQKAGRVVTLNEVTIVGRVQRPFAAVDVARIRPRISLSELRQPFLNRIDQSINKEPF
jgi:hypothetical protein